MMLPFAEVEAGQCAKGGTRNPNERTKNEALQGGKLVLEAGLFSEHPLNERECSFEQTAVDDPAKISDG